MDCVSVGREEVALLLLKPAIFSFRSRGRIVTSDAAVIAVPGSTTDQVKEFVPLTVEYQLDNNSRRTDRTGE